GRDISGPKPVALTGLTTPWNTLALWSVPRLARLGFLAVAEGLLPGVDGGIEEVTAIAALQMLAAARSRPGAAALLRLPGVSWEARWADDGRRRWHERKMASKASRAAAQMAALGLPEGAVYHIE
ncbi:unnamed protein product, partial [Phaeothamnion confervicola]